ncbi:hypothetical protein [Flavobacterium covae]|uniref:hypothetical protein n=1 Tax=Flavobacterium covae TaxID=2906076 RepID=UPI000745CBCA|nr:hypothetical protein [Flavobacterium covae]AMA50576.1 hypothetical protein AWN65_14470 [Flavobacterium covae]MCJ1810345.1 hypothetical protein [Flavobacterium covae]
MNKIKILLKIFLTTILIISCKKNDSKNDSFSDQNKDIVTDTITNVKSFEFDDILKCGEYTNNGDYLTIPDNGCIYKADAKNNFGNIGIYLIPKPSSKLSFEDENIETKVNKMTVPDLKLNFEIFIFLIEAKYLDNSKKLDIPYYPKFPYKENVFKFGSTGWELIKTIEFKDESDGRYGEYVNKILFSNKVLASKEFSLEGDYFIKTKVASVETGDPIDITFNFNFSKSNTILSIGTSNSMEAYCEGEYSISQNNENLKLNYIGEGICTQNKDESAFFIKKENNKVYIKSERFYDNIWQEFKRK